ncbi:hypothetical protein [Streptomyces griseorubiginosus]|uniref:hypothetical protein n=1 Tax=Streptomyces griseorubiginosus TaxID=67304 RepID=UPI003659AD68
MRIRRALAATAAAMMLGGGGVLISAGGAQAAPTPGCHTVIKYVTVVTWEYRQVFENGQWVTKLVPVTVVLPVSTVVCD